MAKKSGFFAEFKTFITRGNVIDMSVGVIVGGAFTAIVNALTNNILRPLINFIIAALVGGEGIEAYTILKPSYVDGQLDLASSIYIDWGAFLSAIINFLLIAFVLFCIIKAINSVRDANEKLSSGLGLNEKKEIKRLCKEEGLTKEQAKVRLEENKKAAEEAAKKAEEEAAKAAKEAEEKAMANTVLLTEIRDLLKKN
ncbi:MAG: large conductance mechanosensitive channel protein MscL [Clostridia bacterium]|nr:large conductance mechanosensitive channel protein MscL [Clostridia bacterium]